MLVYSNEDGDSKRFITQRLFTKKHNQKLQFDYLWKKTTQLMQIYNDTNKLES